MTTSPTEEVIARLTKAREIVRRALEAADNANHAGEEAVLRMAGLSSQSADFGDIAARAFDVAVQTPGSFDEQDAATQAFYINFAVEVSSSALDLIASLTGELEEIRRQRRWNIDRDGSDLLICEGDHHRSADCPTERYVPAEKFEAAEAQRDALQAERDEAISFAKGWHGAVDAICTIMDLGGGLGAGEAVAAVRAKVSALQARVGVLEGARETIVQMLGSSLVGRTHDVWDRAHAAGMRAALKVIDEALTEQPTERGDQGVCKARSGGVGGNDPQDCDWPVCGCDPHADKVIAALEESGLLRPSDAGDVPGWRPIETAPRDGNFYLAHYTSPFGPRVGPFRYANAKDGFLHYATLTERAKATHWQPLPAPPEPDQQPANSGEGA